MKNLITYFLTNTIILVITATYSVKAEALTFSHTYDNLHRLTSIERSDGTVTVYEYDELGNRILKVTTTEPSDYFCDNDTDGFIDSSSDGTCNGYGCEPPECQITPGSDCNDGDPNNWTSCASCVDNDIDTYFVSCDAYITIYGPDCNDSNPLEHPDQIWYVDNDGDGFGYYSLSTQQCTQPAGYVSNDLDYDDTEENIGPPVKIDSGTVYYYSSLQDAYDAAADDDTIQVIAMPFFESLFVDRNISVILQGGYDGLYLSISGDTILQGDINISNGTITIENFLLQQ